MNICPSTVAQQSTILHKCLTTAGNDGLRSVPSGQVYTLHLTIDRTSLHTIYNKANTKISKSDRNKNPTKTYHCVYLSVL